MTDVRYVRAEDALRPDPDGLPFRPGSIAIVTIGLPASGKTTFARTLANAAGFADVNRDDTRFVLYGIEPPGKGSRTQEDAVTASCREKIRAAAEAGRNVVVSDTNLTEHHRDDLVEYLRRMGFDRVNALVFDTPFRVCCARNARRGDLAVPDAAMDRMLASFEEQAPWFGSHPNMTPWRSGGISPYPSKRGVFDGVYHTEGGNA